MPEFDVYRAGRKIASKSFRKSFYIVKELGVDVLRWEADEEQNSPQQGGIIHVWVQLVSLAPVARYQISFVRSDWQLIMDGMSKERRFYPKIEIETGVIELRHNDYNFVCSFGY